VPYTDQDFEAVIARYLADDNARRKIASAGRARAAERTFDALWTRAVAGLDRDWKALVHKARSRPALSPEDALLLRVAQAVGTQTPAVDAKLESELESAACVPNADPRLLHALGVIRALHGDVTGATGCYGRAAAVACHPVLPALGLIECLAALGRD